MTYINTYNEWLNNTNLEPNLKSQLEQMNETEKEDSFYKDLEFGTGGMRGVLGAGTNRMNVYTIRKANIGFAKYLLEQYSDAKERGVVIAYDNRHMSYEFAVETACVMGTFGIKAYLYESLRPTPQLSYSVRELNCVGGVMITASHNPKEYNGYKIYDHNGCQLVPELADIVINHVNEVKDILSQQVVSYDELNEKGLVEVVGSKLDQLFDEQVKSIQLNPEVNKSNLKIVFTPEHGTANEPVQRILRDLGYNIVVVEEQASPDPDFSGTKSANPEETEAFALAIEYGKRENADILIATDPDADRLGVAVLHNGEYELLTGNQTGALLIDYILTNRKKQNTLPTNGIVFNTVVTSEFGAVIAKHFGLDVESTLTGFKFIGDRINKYEKLGTKEFVFGYEESYGYLLKSYARDKDAIGAVLMACEMAAFYKEKGVSLYERLSELYAEFGYYRETLVSVTLKGKDGLEQIKAIMSGLRNQTPTSIAGRKVIAHEDYDVQTRFEGNTKTSIELPQSDVLKFFLENDAWFAVRPSGTEPKIKFYFGVKEETLETALNQLENIKKAVLDIVEN